jgi:SAM-dependent methyltransferase
MRYYREHVYPLLVSLLGDPKPIREVRRRIVPMAEGTVLEIGVGPGVNFPHYDPKKIRKLFALEPNRGMVRLAKKRRRQSNLDVEFLEFPGEHIPLEDGSVDTVVSTFTFCTIPGVAEAIQNLGRVLRPGGRLIFFEHGLSPDLCVRRWQKRWEPITCRVFGGCHLTRDVPALIAQGGFQIEQMETAYLASFPKSVAHCWWGVAIPQTDTLRRSS